VDIGPALAEARTKAGMTIDDVSERTRIRRQLISDIEHDDYSACGGDFYTRGHIRAIAKVVGTDPVPLIEEYDGYVAGPPAAPVPVLPEPGHENGFGTEPRPRPGVPPTQSDSWLARTFPAVTSPRPPEAWPGREPEADLAGPPADPTEAPANLPDLAARADPDDQADPRVQADPADPADQTDLHDWEIVPRSRPDWAGSARARYDSARARYDSARARFDRAGWLVTFDWRIIAAAGVVVLAVLITLIVLLLSGSSPGTGHAAGAAGRHHPAAIGRTVRTTSTPRPRASAAPAAGQAAVPLRPVSAAAFGPGGTGQGDNPGQASLAISGRSGPGWQTNWYTSADFGNLQPGTGLLLDMGRVVTVSSVRVRLGGAGGGALELRAGDQPALAALRPVARSGGARGTLTLVPGAPTTARYVLIWFTRLPLDSAGTYQATVYHVSVIGRA
jgi:transcriptional regulator with XRE-family HTH domain